ncbi:MAG: SDR family NAD(P)-dependent oxidoreductase [Parcubacteria group bacterium]|nr:SDR family NAD(P)-dependent oxidoreductase [Parcubacteria group bacterium]
MFNWAGRTVLVTGGAGSIGSAVVTRILEAPVHALRVFDVNEDALFKLGRRVNKDSKMRLLLGDIRDRERVKMAIRGVDTVLHLASVKNIEVSEYNASEACRVNIEGTINLIETCLKASVDRFLTVSSDKAAKYSTLYGATKYIQEKLTSWAASISDETVFASARFGNVVETRGNVFEVWRKENSEGKPLSVTHPDMKRYLWHLSEAAEFIVNRVEDMENGYIYVPKMKEHSILELAKQYGKTGSFSIIGLRPGEKIREDLMFDFEKGEDRDTYWAIKG